MATAVIRPKLAAGQSAQFFVYRGQFYRYRETRPVAGFLQQFEFRIEEYKISVVAVEIDTSEHYDFPAGIERPALVNELP